MKARLGLRRDVQSRLGARRRPDAKKLKKNWAKEECLAEDSSYATIDQVFAVFSPKPLFINCALSHEDAYFGDTLFHFFSIIPLGRRS